MIFSHKRVIFHLKNTSSLQQILKQSSYNIGVYIRAVEPLPYQDVSLIPNHQLDDWLAYYLNSSQKTWFTRSHDDIAVLEGVIAVMGLRAQYALCLRSVVGTYLANEKQNNIQPTGKDIAYHASQRACEEEEGLVLWYALSTASPRQRAEALYLTLTEFG